MIKWYMLHNIYVLYFLILASYDNLAENFTEECIKKCNEALQFLANIVDKLNQRKLTVQELEMLTLHLAQVVKLFSSVAETITGDLSFSIADAIAEKNSEIKRFESYRSTVKILLKYCESISNGMYIY